MTFQDIQAVRPSTRMFINANPRYVSNGCFENFVPYQQVESALHQRLVEMTNNDVNAWSVFRPVSATVDGWDDQVDFNGDENFPAQSLYGRQYQQAYSTVQQQNYNFAKTTPYTTVNQGQPNMRSTSQRVYQPQPTSMNCVDSSPMLGNDYVEWSVGRGRGSFAEFSKTTNAAKNFQYQTADNMNTSSFASNSTIPATMSAYTTMAPVAIGDSFSVDNTSPSTAYSSYSSTNTSIEPNEVMTFDSAGMKDEWWTPRNCKAPYPTDFDVMPGHDGLPRYQIQQTDNPWDIGISLDVSHLISSDTVSPKDVLRLDVPLAMSTSGSSQGTVAESSDSSTGCSSRDNSADYSGSEKMSVVEQPVHRHRQMLPTEPEVSRRHVPMVPSNDYPPSTDTRRSSVRTKSSTKPTSPNDSLYSPPPPKRSDVLTPKTLSPKKIEPKPTPKITLRHSPKPTAIEQATHQRSEKDNFLINSKLAGMSYKDIRRKGNFTEAESTLRGRFRTLTKNKAARVRKPEWDDNDIRLLKKAVRRLTNESETAKGKIPWKQVAEYIANNGGSYHFGNATCRKRWDELQGNRRMSD